MTELSTTTSYQPVAAPWPSVSPSLLGSGSYHDLGFHNDGFDWRQTPAAPVAIAPRSLQSRPARFPVKTYPRIEISLASRYRRLQRICDEAQDPSSSPWTIKRGQAALSDINELTYYYLIQDHFDHHELEAMQQTVTQRTIDDILSQLRIETVTRREAGALHMDWVDTQARILEEARTMAHACELSDFPIITALEDLLINATKNLSVRYTDHVHNLKDQAYALAEEARRLPYFTSGWTKTRETAAAMHDVQSRWQAFKLQLDAEILSLTRDVRAARRLNSGLACDEVTVNIWQLENLLSSLTKTRNFLVYHRARVSMGMMTGLYRMIDNRAAIP